MGDRLLDIALRKRFLFVLLGVFLAGAGFWAFSRLRLEAYPDISGKQVTIITLHPGYAPEEVEQQITIPIERAVNSVPHVIGRRSRTIFGLSVVDLIFRYDIDVYLSRQMVLEKLGEAELPAGVTPMLAPPTTPAGELYRYALEGDSFSEMELREIQDWVIAPRLLQVPGVGDAFAFGGLVKQYQIEVDPLALYRYALSIGEIAEAVEANNVNAGGSVLRSGEQALVVRGVGLIRNATDIESIVVTTRNGNPIYVRDIGSVEIGAPPRTGIFGLDDRTHRVEGIVGMRRGENASEVLRGVIAAIGELNSGGLPPGVRIEPIYDRTELVESTLTTVSRTLLEALAVVFLVLLFFLGSFRAALLTALTVPLSLLFAFVCMYLAGVPASLLSLGALDFGIIVDGTLVMVEFIVRRLAREPDRGQARSFELIRSAASHVQRPIFFSLLILIAAYLPLFALQRAEGRLFSPMAFTVCAALVGSMFFALTLVPVLATYVFRQGCRAWKNPLVLFMTRQYEVVLRGLLRRGWAVILMTLVILGGTAWLSTKLGSEFLPHLDEGVVWVRAKLPPGISVEKSAEVANRLRAIAMEFQEVRHVSSQTGRQESNTEPFGPNQNELLLVLEPYETWTSGRSKEEFVEELAGRYRNGVPGVAFSFTQPIIDMVAQAITGSSADLAVIVSGPDLDVLRDLASQTLTAINSIEGASDTAIEQEGDQPQLRININRRQVARYGLNIADVQEVIDLAIGGRPVSTMFEGDRRFDITVRYTPEARSTLAGIGNILVTTPAGARVPLSALAAIEVVNGPSIIARRENRRQIAVATNIRGRDQGGFVAEAQRAFRERVKLPAGYDVDWGGGYENLERARRRLAWILPVTVAIIFGLLYWTFGSTLAAALVLFNVPFSIVGGVAALYLRDIPFSVSAAVGFISLFGVAVMSGVLYVDEIRRQRRDYERPLKEAVLVGACAQLRPRLILIIVALLGIVPATFAAGIGSDIQRPLATVIFGGLFSTLFLTLFALPCLYYVAERRRN
jgi:heavy metal efflux system protein